MVRTTTPPTVEVVSSVGAVYVRFKRAKVAKTIPQDAKACSISIDLDSKGGVIGIEVIGFSTFNLATIFKMARVKVPETDFSRANYVPADLAAA